jgi:hypothetical protein
MTIKIRTAAVDTTLQTTIGSSRSKVTKHINSPLATRLTKGPLYIWTFGSDETYLLLYFISMGLLCEVAVGILLGTWARTAQVFLQSNSQTL